MDFGYAAMFDCKTPEDVERTVKQLSSVRSDREHIIRSAILDMHLRVENQLLSVLYRHMLDIMPLETEDEPANETRRKKLKKSISKRSFTDAHRLLQPCLEAFADEDLGLLSEINRLRNDVAHGATGEVDYGGCNPFSNHECLAKYLFDCFAAMKALAHFYERMIEDPRAMCLDLQRRFEAQQSAPRRTKRRR